MDVSDIKPGVRVNGIRRRGGTCTGRLDALRRVPAGEWRAEVNWDAGDTTWPLISILTDESEKLADRPLSADELATLGDLLRRYEANHATTAPVMHAVAWARREVRRTRERVLEGGR